MEERPLRRALCLLDYDGGRGVGKLRKVGDALALKVRAFHHDRPAPRRPDAAEMGLAAAGRAAQRQSRRRPVGPAVDPGQRLAVAVGDDEILAGIGRRRKRKIEGQLVCHDVRQADQLAVPR